jgi:transposase InsO family protein
MGLYPKGSLKKVKYKHFQTRYFRSFTIDFINFYNNRRIHGSLKFQSPNVAL